VLQGKLNLVDLAGSERQAKTGAAGDRLKAGPFTRPVAVFSTRLTCPSCRVQPEMISATC
jgi:hypothetical protein